jgi:hypothetical protein
MKYLRVIDEVGNKQDYESEFLPRIGERIVMEFGKGNEPVREHFFRVKDVAYRLDAPLNAQVSIRVEEERNPERWPS